MEQGIPLNAGESIPKIILEEVPVLEIGEPYWSAWSELSGQRPVGGMGALGELRREAVTDWLDENGIEHPYERSRYRRILAMMDREYLSAVAERAAKESKKVRDSAGKVGSGSRGRKTERVRV